MSLKIGGSNVGKIMYNGQEFGGATKLEPGAILYIAKIGKESFENAHLLSTTKNWNNINGISIVEAASNDVTIHYNEINISGDDFKNLNVEKKYKLGSEMVTVSISTVDGEYRLNASGYHSSSAILITAL